MGEKRSRNLAMPYRLLNSTRTFANNIKLNSLSFANCPVHCNENLMPEQKRHILTNKFGAFLCSFNFKFGVIILSYMAYSPRREEVGLLNNAKIHEKDSDQCVAASKRSRQTPRNRRKRTSWSTDTILTNCY